jgi:hypothetical protein
MRAILLALLGPILALPAAAQQPTPVAPAATVQPPAAPATEQRPQQDSKVAEELKRQRERAVELCNANRGTDCDSDEGLAEWRRMERPRSEAEAEGSRSIHQTAPKPATGPAN